MHSKLSKLFITLIVVGLCASSLASPILDDIFKGFLSDVQLNKEQPGKDIPVVKRRIFAENPDATLKQVSLQSLIGDVEDSLFQTALSVNSVATNRDAQVPEVRPDADANSDRTLNKREAGEKVSATTEANPAGGNILLQTTQKVPAANGVPGYVLIDRVAVQPHQGGLPFIPAFQVYQTKVISATFKDPSSNSDSVSVSTTGGNNGGATKISIAKTNVQAIGTTNPNDASQQQQQPPQITTTKLTVGEQPAAATKATTQPQKSEDIKEQISRTESSPSSSSPPSSTASTTTKIPPIVQLKEAEENLKEKVAEVEAEPVILTARV